MSAASLALLALAGCYTADSVVMKFRKTDGRFIPAGLANPDKWMFQGRRDTPGKELRMTWIKPSASDPHQWTEMFEYQSIARPAVTPQQYLDTFKELAVAKCPDSTLTPIEMGDHEVLFELKSRGCPHVSNQDEIQRLLFGAHHLFNIAYTVNAREMTSEQRKMGIAAVSACDLMQTTL